METGKPYREGRQFIVVHIQIYQRFHLLYILWQVRQVVIRSIQGLYMCGIGIGIGIRIGIGIGIGRDRDKDRDKD